ncbi:carcinoembryonic antigen-related cell adhesion molecule 1 [Syngnathoides biaculeatus]|uniref:carcinoembryonic antigen-related cell adhesion molecule 1 n=1 Tax=Syngnathoides biaculeatus TaxID=300417 RepID=UPI002ADD7FCB|nr:carcinoembryonic antigen-related cell adhesion molecule 1 [Syngnathoides biaculeatus]
MEPHLVCLVVISMLFCTTEHVRAQAIQASENPIPVGKNVTLFSKNQVTTGAWLFNNQLVVIIFPGGEVIAANWTGRVLFNSTTSALTVMSLSLAESGTYTLQDVGSSASQLVLSVRELISGVNIMANATDLVEFNDTVTVTCTVVTGTSLSFTWLNDTAEVMAGGYVHISDDGSQLTIAKVKRYDEGPFKCNVTNGISQEISSSVQFNISYGPTAAAVSVVPPLHTHITGSNITLSCGAESKPPAAIQWMLDGMNLNHSGVELELPMVTENHTGEYKCLLHNSVTSRFTNASAMIRIIAPITAVTVNHTGGVAMAQEPFTLNCHVNGEVDIIQWWMNGHLVSADNTTVFDAENRTLTLNPVQPSDAGHYKCRAFNAVSNVTSSPYNLEVYYGPKTPEIMAPSVALIGNQVLLNCTSLSHPPSVYSWHFNETEVANTSEYLAGPLAFNMSGTYTCMAFNNITGRNSTADHMLTVLDEIKYVHIQLPVHPPVEGYSFMMMCNVSGPVDQVAWRVNGTPLITDDRIMMSADNRTVTFNELHRNDSGLYHCWAFNLVQQIVSPPHLLIVNFGPETPMIYGPSMAVEGQSVNFSCSAMSLPDSHVTWWYNGTMVANSSLFVSSPLTVNMSGNYTCKARNPLSGKNSTSVLMLHVLEAIKSVTLKNNTIPIDGDNFTLTCEVDGHYTSIQWMKDGMHLTANWSTANHTNYSIQDNRLHFLPLTRADDGMYECVANNSVSLHKSPPYELLVNYGPLSVTISGPDLAKEDLTISINCIADSRPESEYQWFMNDKPTSAFAFGSMIQIPLLESNYTCKARNPVTNITMSKTKSFSLIGSASALHCPPYKVLIIIGVFIISIPVLFH